MNADIVGQLGEYGVLGLCCIYLAYQNSLQGKRLESLRETFRESLSDLTDKVDEAVRLLRDTQQQQQMMLAMKAARAKTTSMPAVKAPEDS